MAVASGRLELWIALYTRCAASFCGRGSKFSSSVYETPCGSEPFCEETAKRVLSSGGDILSDSLSAVLLAVFAAGYT